MPEENFVVADNDILTLLKASEQPQERAMLSVMLKMTQALESNTEATEAIARGFHEHVKEFKSHREEFDAHVKDEIALFNQGRGMQKMLTWSVSAVGAVMAMIMAMGLYILNGHVEGLKHERASNDDQEKRLTVIEQGPRIGRGEFEDLRNRVFKLEAWWDTHVIPDHLKKDKIK